MCLGTWKPKTRGEKPYFFGTWTREMVPELNPNPTFGTFCTQKPETQGEKQTFLVLEPDPNPRKNTQTRLLLPDYITTAYWADYFCMFG